MQVNLQGISLVAIYLNKKEKMHGKMFVKHIVIHIKNLMIQKHNFVNKLF